LAAQCRGLEGEMNQRLVSKYMKWGPARGNLDKTMLRGGGEEQRGRYGEGEGHFTGKGEGK